MDDIGRADEAPPDEARRDTEAAEKRARRLHSGATLAAVILSALIIPFKYGFDHAHTGDIVLSVVEILIAVFFAIMLAVGWHGFTDKQRFLKERGGETACLVLLLIVLAFLGLAEGWRPWSRHFVVGVEVYLGLNVVLMLVHAERALLRLPIRPVQVFVLSFAAIILTGGALLYFLPRATRSPDGISLVDALFTATSATCVTGLTVVDTGQTFTRLGQTILALLIQVGGLGIMTFAAFFALALGKGIGIRERAVMKSVLNLEFIGDMGRLIVFILILTFGFEAAGAALTVLMGIGADHPEGAVWYAVFHSVSAFCNAGFCLEPDSWVRYRGNVPFMAVQMGLIISGGLGFLVLRDLASQTSRLRRLPALLSRSRRKERSGPVPRMSLHSRLVIPVTVLLLGGGTLLFYLLERKGVLAGMGGFESVWTSLFQSATARTAGFNTVDIGALAIPTLLLMMVLMFIGASPGSTGGGIKTTSFAIMILAVVATFRGRHDVELMGRRLPSALLGRVMVLGFVSTALVGFLVGLMATIEPGLGLGEAAFEVVSAFGTVGLSTGITPELSQGGKMVITSAMFIGRLGPLTLVWAMGTTKAKARWSYPEEKVMIG